MLRMGGAELSVLISGPRTVRALNSEWRGKDTTTDVLSFPAHRNPMAAYRRGERFIGDIAIDASRAAEQASERGITVDDEVSRLMVHGMLHLMGYDHERGGPEARRMRAAEARVLKALGMGDS